MINQATANDAAYFLLNEHGLVCDISEATVVVTRDAAALHKLLESFEDADGHMDRDEYAFWSAAHNVPLGNTRPIAFQWQYCRDVCHNVFVQTESIIAKCLWENREDFLD
jgi:hypothetical protein